MGSLCVVVCCGVAVAAVVGGGVAGVAGVAESAAPLGVVGVLACCCELCPGVGEVVGVDAGGLVAEDADGVSLEDGAAEEAFVVLVVATLAGGGAGRVGAGLLCLACCARVWLAPCRGGEGGAAGFGADLHVRWG